MEMRVARQPRDTLVFDGLIGSTQIDFVYNLCKVCSPKVA